MHAHFRAFSFVDRIHRHDAGSAIHGSYYVPSELEAFPGSLVAEAVGQLAAWAAMEAVGFTHRPVAGIAGCIELLHAVEPGETIELFAAIESVDTETAGYAGEARAGDRTVLRLRDCVGPMVLVEEFDDPQALRDRFALLSGSGAVPGAFSGVPEQSLERISAEAGTMRLARLHVPEKAPFFADHFPRRPVFPGTLMMHANLCCASELASELPAPAGSAWRVARVEDVKLRAFIPPGEVLTVEARVSEQTADQISITVETRMKQKLAASAEVVFAPGGVR